MKAKAFKNRSGQFHALRERVFHPTLVSRLDLTGYAPGKDIAAFRSRGLSESACRFPRMGCPVALREGRSFGNGRPTGGARLRGTPAQPLPLARMGRWTVTRKFSEKIACAAAKLLRKLPSRLGPVTPRNSTTILRSSLIGLRFLNLRNRSGPLPPPKFGNHVPAQTVDCLGITAFPLGLDLAQPDLQLRRLAFRRRVRYCLLRDGTGGHTSDRDRSVGTLIPTLRSEKGKQEKICRFRIGSNTAEWAGMGMGGVLAGDFPIGH